MILVIIFQWLEDSATPLGTNSFLWIEAEKKHDLQLKNRARES